MNEPNNTDPSEALTPRATRRKFMNAKRGTVKDSSLRAYKFPTKDFVEFCEDQGVESIGEVDNYLIESWIQKREAENIKPITVNNNVRFLRVFIKYCENAGLLDGGTYDRIRLPDVPDEERSSDKTLLAHQANSILDHLSTYEYATRKHAAFALIWETGCRVSGAMSLDLEDVTSDRQGDPALRFSNRKGTGTPLKNGDKSNRLIQLSETLQGILNDYIEVHRNDVTDDYDRKPLFTTPAGRVSRQVLYKDTVAITRPCVYSGRCPAGREIETCEPAQRKKSAMSCPENVSLHPIRRGSITHHINEGWEKEILSERVDVSVEVLENHYDARTEEDELQRRKKHKRLL
jgi:site-specific recombinase XerD